VGLFVAPSRFLRQKHLECGIVPDRVEHIPNFVVSENYTPSFVHEGYFAYVGRLTPFKGVETLLQAAARAHTSVPLLVVGDGPSRQDLEAQAKGAMPENIRFIGHQSGTALRDLIAKAMFVVVPSEWYENFPYAVLEAFALGTPVLGTAIGGIPELVEPGINGMLVPPNEPDALAEGIQQMLSTDAALSAMGRAGRECIEELYNEKQHTSALARAYTRIGAPSPESESPM
jgi:glycosyltransferase involved in cell wall biosynthesis